MVAYPKSLILLAALVTTSVTGPRASELQPAADTPLPARQVTDNSGAPVTRIISIVPALTEMLFAVGAGPQVIAVSSYDKFPPAVETLPRVGALLDPDVERILTLRPDLVLIYGSQHELKVQLTKAGIRTFTYRHTGVAGVLQALRELSAATGHSADGERKAREIQTQLDTVRARVRGYPRPRTLLVLTRKPQSLQQMYVSGDVGFLNDILQIAGGDNVFAGVQRESVQPSHETLLARAPDAIVELHAAGMMTSTDLERERTLWATLASIPAVRRNRVHFLEGSYFVIPGPRMGLAAQALARVLHPEAFE